MINKKIICTIMLLGMLTGCESGNNNKVNTAKLQESQTKISQQNQTDENKKNETEQKNESEKKDESNENKEVEKIENEIDLSEIDLGGEDKVSGIKVGGFFTDSKNWRFAYKKFTGIGTIRKFKCNEDSEMEFEYSSETSKGNINVIILDEDYNILKKFGANESKTFKLNVIKDKVYSIRIIGENAEEGQALLKVLNTNHQIESID